MYRRQLLLLLNQGWVPVVLMIQIRYKIRYKIRFPLSRLRGSQWRLTVLQHLTLATRQQMPALPQQLVLGRLLSVDRLSNASVLLLLLLLSHLGQRQRQRQRAVKLGAFAPSSPDLTGPDGAADPGESLQRAMTPEDEAEVRRFADACLPGLKGGEVVDFAACMFTDTPDGHFLLDLHPRHSGGGGGKGSRDAEGARVVLCSACSGHGFKLSPAVGEALAEMAVGEQERDDGGDDGGPLALHRLRPERPGMAEVLQRFAARGR